MNRALNWDDLQVFPELALLPLWLAAGDPDLRPVPGPVLGEEPPLTREAWLVLHPDLRDVPRVRVVIEHLVALFTAEFTADSVPVG